MKHTAYNRLTYVKNILFPCLLFSSVTGILTGLLICLFKFVTGKVVSLSEWLYAIARQDLRLLPLLFGGAVLAGLMAAALLRVAPHCRGGGIPTSVAILRGQIDFQWLKNLVVLFPSAMLTYLCGVPLGTEGPCVQMGTAVGRGTVHIFAKKNRAWDRYIMTGGACAGFAAATGAPLTGIFFAFEEAHRRFSPMIFMTAAMSAVAATATMTALCGYMGISPTLFEFAVETVLPLRYVWAPLLVGVVCGLCAVLFTKLYHLVGTGMKKGLARMPFVLKVMIVFVATALMGMVSAALIGSGHGLVEEVLERHGIWYLLVLYLCARAILLIVANHVGVTGGLFVPSLAFGAMIGALCTQVMTAVGILPSSYGIVLVIVGMASFLGASSRIPMTAVTFAIEALCGLSNILPIAMGVTFAYLVIETMGVEGLSEAVIDSKIEAENEGKTAVIVDVSMTVSPTAFAVGKEIRDILWPPTCTVLSVRKNPSAVGQHGFGISAGDVLTLHYRTHDPAKTKEILESIVGRQTENTEGAVSTIGAGQQVPEL